MKQLSQKFINLSDDFFDQPSAARLFIGFSVFFNKYAHVSAGSVNFQIKDNNLNVAFNCKATDEF